MSDNWERRSVMMSNGPMMHDETMEEELIDLLSCHRPDSCQKFFTRNAFVTCFVCMGVPYARKMERLMLGATLSGLRLWSNKQNAQQNLVWGFQNKSKGPNTEHLLCPPMLSWNPAFKACLPKQSA